MEPDLIAPMVIAKLAGGVLCVISAMFFLKLDSKLLEETPA